ncbi:MAG: MFS transporter [Pseudomonadota bacterium]|nr:MFS transporter [Pseudomonadota bacterium]
MSSTPQELPRRVWLMGLANMSYGYGYAVVLVTAPQLLAARGVPEPTIANLTALVMTVGLATFALAPLLDCWVSRRSWAIGLALLAASLMFATLMLPAHSPLFAAALCSAGLTLSLYSSAIGGWLGAALPKSADETIGTWFNIGNASGFGIGAQVQFWLLTHLSVPLGPAIVVALGLLPLATLAVMPSPDAERSAMRESFGRLARDMAQLLRQGSVLRILALFILPCGAFTLTNAFGGIGGAFHASPALVDSATGFISVIVCLIAALLFKPLLTRVRAPLAYLAVGTIGAIFTLSLLSLPLAPWVFVLAVVGENIAQTCAQIAQNTMVFRSIPLGSALASSQFGLLSTAATVPYAYMQALDGRGYGWRGVSGSFLTDAFISMAACALVLVPVLRWLRAGKLEAPQDTPAHAPA